MAFIWIVMFAFSMIFYGQSGRADYLELAKFYAVLSTVNELIPSLYSLIKEKTREINIRNDINRVELQKKEREL